MKKMGIMLVLVTVLMSFIIGATAEPVLPKYVVPLNNRTNIRSETSRTGDNIILEVDVDDVLQVIGYSYDMEGNLWWRVIDYQSNEDGYAIAALFSEINESQAIERKKQIDEEMNTSRAEETIEQNEIEEVIPEWLQGISEIAVSEPTVKPLNSLVPSFVESAMPIEEIPVIRNAFSIRNGIRYHMTRQEVLNAEIAYGTNMENLRLNTTFGVVGGIKQEQRNVIDAMRINLLKVLGKNQDTSSLLFLFNENDQLIEMFYQINSGEQDRYSYPAFEAAEDYKQIRKSLIDKYGQPYGSRNNGKDTLGNIHTHAFSEINARGVKCTTSTCTQWIVRYDDCYCIVELFIRDPSDLERAIGNVPDLRLAYRLLSEDELRQASGEAQQQEDYKNRDI